MKTLDSIQAFCEGWRFPVVMISLLGAFVLLMAGILLMPSGPGAAGAFAEAFRVWCFNYDPATGRLEWGYVWMYVVQPLVLAAGIYVLWRQPIREGLAGGLRRVWPYVGSACAVVAGLAVGLFTLSGWEARAAGDAVFPAERIRTAHTPPPFALVDQEGETVTLAALDGRVVLVTAVYATCGLTCPAILGQTKRVLTALTPGEQAGLTVVAITLDPARDTPEVLRRLTEAQGLQAPLFHAVTGAPAYVEDVLDRYQFARRRNPETGQIDHANLFILIDRAGRIAYRFTLGPQQAVWLEAALHQLLREGARG
jgi:protein SCO1/2